MIAPIFRQHIQTFFPLHNLRYIDVKKNYCNSKIWDFNDHKAIGRGYTTYKEISLTNNSMII